MRGGDGVPWPAAGADFSVYRPYKPPLSQRGLPLLINIEARGRRLFAMKPHAAAHQPLHPVLLCLLIRIRQTFLGVVLAILLL